MTLRPVFIRLTTFLFLMASVPAFAANRTVTINAPTGAAPGSTIHASIAASTDVPGEAIGFLHSEYSNDGGKTWVSFSYQEKLANTAAQIIDLPAGPAGAKIVIRARVAFRGGKAGDVDFNGAPLDWSGTWEKWRTPPTKYAIIYVR